LGVGMIGIRRDLSLAASVAPASAGAATQDSRLGRQRPQRHALGCGCRPIIAHNADPPRPGSGPPVIARCRRYHPEPLHASGADGGSPTASAGLAWTYQHAPASSARAREVRVEASV
jgi:hypothetical protein